VLIDYMSPSGLITIPCRGKLLTCGPQNVTVLEEVPMRRYGSCLLAAGVLLTGLGVASGTAWAAWPERTVRIITPFNRGI
jgi:hypothetical protein